MPCRPLELLKAATGILVSSFASSSAITLKSSSSVYLSLLVLSLSFLSVAEGELEERIVVGLRWYTWLFIVEVACAVEDEIWTISGAGSTCLSILLADPPFEVFFTSSDAVDLGFSGLDDLSESSSDDSLSSSMRF